MNTYKSLGETVFKGKYNKYSTLYYMLKKYAKILIINRESRSGSFFEQVNHVYYLDKDLTLNEIIQYILNLDNDLEEGYFLLQDLYKISKQSTFESAKTDILKWIDKGFGLKDFETFRAKILYTNSKNMLSYKY